VLYLTLLVFPLDALINIGGAGSGGEGINATHVFTLLLFMVCAVKIWWNRDTRPFQYLYRNVIPLLILAYLGINIFSMLVSRTPQNGIMPILQRISTFMFYVFIVYVAKDRRTLKRCIIWFVSSSILASFAGSYEIVTRKAVVEGVRISETTVREELQAGPTGKFRIQGLSKDPDQHGAQLIIQLGCLLYLTMCAPWWKWKLVLCLLLLMVMGNVVACSARAVWLGLAVVLAVFFALAPLRRKMLVALGAGGVLVAAFFFLIIFFPQLEIIPRMFGHQDTGHYSTHFRYEMFEMSLKMGEENPWFGVGTGNFEIEYRRLVRDIPYLPRRIAYVPHHVYMGVLAENGLPGLIVYSLMHLAIILQLLTCFIRARDREAKLMAIGLLSAFAGFMVCANFYHVWGSKYAWAVMSFAAALSLVLKKEERDLEMEQNSVHADPAPEASFPVS